MLVLQGAIASPIGFVGELGNERRGRDILGLQETVGSDVLLDFVVCARLYSHFVFFLFVWCVSCLCDFVFAT